MITKVYDGITYETDLEDITDEEIAQYREVILKHNKGVLKDVAKVTIKDVGNGKVDLSYDTVKTVKFERIARVSK